MHPSKPPDADGGFIGGAYGRLLLPAVVFQSVLIGGGYATGREVVEYGARLGVLGLWSIAAAAIGFAVAAAVSYEFARTFQVYNYRAFMRALIGPFWPLFDLLFLIMVVIVIAVMASAAGVIGKQILGLPEAVGVALVVLSVAVLNFRGGKFIEKAKSVGTVALYGAYIAFAATVLSQKWASVSRVLGSGDSSYAAGATTASALGVGVLYVAYNLTVMPTVLFTLHRQKHRREAIWGGLLTGVLAIVPFILTYLCLLSFYPDGKILAAEVPWLRMLQAVGGPVLIAIFAGVVIFTLIETATGNTHAISDRIDDTLRDLGKSPMTRKQAAIFTGAVVLAGALLSQVGIVELVSKGYHAMAYGFLVVFVGPLLTIGVWKIYRHDRQQSNRAATVKT